MKTLIVDDQKDNIYLLESLLRGYGHNVTSAANGAEALEILKSEMFDLIISDILMPVMDGFQLCRKVRADETLRHIPLVFYTASYTGKEDETFAFKVGANRFIQKPCEPDTFIEAIREVMESAGRTDAASAQEQGEEAEILKLYSERLVRKLEQKMAALETEVKKRRESEEALRQSEATLHSVFLASPVGICIMKNRVYQRANAFWCDSFGYPEESIIGKDTRMLYENDEEYNRVGQELYKNLQERGLASVETKLRRSDGVFRDVIVLAAPLQPDDMTAGIVAIIHDITEKKQAEKALTESEKKYRELYDFLPIPVYEMDLEGTIISANHAIYETFRGTEEDLKKGFKIWQILSPQDIDKSRKNIQLLLQGGQIRGTDYVLKRMDGSVFPAIVISSLIHSNGRPVGLRGAIIDITDRKQAEEALMESEEKYRSLFDNSIDAVMLTMPDGSILEANPEACRIFGRTEEEICQLGRVGIVDPTDPRLNAALEERRRTGLFRGELTFVHKDGTVFPGEVSSSMFKDREGNLRTSIVIRDITGRKRTEEALRESEEKYRGILDNMDDAYYELDLKGNLVFFNEDMILKTGYSRGELMGMNYRQYISPESCRTVSKVFSQIYKTGRPVRLFDYEVIMKDGQKRDYESWADILLDNKQQPVGFRGMARDITTRKLAEKALLKKHEELEVAHEELKQAQARIIQQEKMASIGQLSAGIAHEINNPTSFVGGNLDILKSYIKSISESAAAQERIAMEHLPPEALQAIRDLRKKAKIDFILKDIGNLIEQSLEGTERIKRIVADLKSFSRMEDDIQTMEDINAGLESTINIVWNEIKYKAEMLKELSDLPTTLCNIGHLNQVFMNLLVNAAHAIEKWGKITVKSWQDGDDIYVSVADTGTGIAKENLTRIFDPFFTTKEKGRGTGLGLSISYDIVKRHNGDIFVNSELGKGTTFTVRIPVVKS